MTFAARCRLYGVRIAAYDLASRRLPLVDALWILRWSRIGQVCNVGHNVWVPIE